jgi:hypothetical protein
MHNVLLLFLPLLLIGLRHAEEIRRTINDLRIPGVMVGSAKQGLQNDMTVVEAALAGLLKPLTASAVAGFTLDKVDSKQRKEGQVKKTLTAPLDFKDATMSALCLANVHARVALALLYLDPIQESRIPNPYKLTQVINTVCVELSAIADHTDRLVNDATAADPATHAQQVSSVFEQAKSAVVKAKSVASYLTVMHLAGGYHTRQQAGMAEADGEDAVLTGAAAAAAPNSSRPKRASATAAEALWKAAAGQEADEGAVVTGADDDVQQQKQQQRKQAADFQAAAAAVTAAADAVTTALGESRRTATSVAAAIKSASAAAKEALHLCLTSTGTPPPFAWEKCTVQ